MSFRCRCCDSEITGGCLLQYDGMPKSAQFFPDREEILTERGVDIRLYQCPWCGLLQLEGEPVPYFREVIRAVGVSEEMQTFRRGQYQQFVEKYQLSGKKVLEVGAGSGEYMSAMKETGAKVYGLEYGNEALQKGRKNGFKIWEGFPTQDFAIPEAPYDAFYCMNFLEHIPDPADFLKNICQNLTEEGVGLVEVPNTDMILKKNLFSEFISDHLLYFTADTFKQLLGINGFEVLECGTVWHEYILSAEVRIRKTMAVDGFVQQRRTLTTNLNSYLEQKSNENKCVAVWGAGHQALATLALTGAADKIVCVIDSAEFKQGYYTPATHLPVEPPRILEEGQIQAVLIMAASYSQEIAEIIHKRYPNVEAAVLTEVGEVQFPDREK